MKRSVGLFIALCTTALSQVYGGTNGPGDASFAFTENKGQLADQFYHSRNDIQFRLAVNDMNVFIGNGRLHYQWYRQGSDDSTDIYRLDVILEGADARAVAIAEQQQPGYDRYYLPQCPNGATAYSFKKITYKNIYPHIDWVLYTTGNHLKYDFIVHEGGNPADIRLTYNGASTLLLEKGEVTAVTPFGSVTEEAPYSYNAETKAAVNTSFVQSNNTIGFQVAAYTGTLVIDPGVTLNWATCYGGTLMDSAGRITTDKAGNVIVCGSSKSAGDIATAGAYQTTVSGLTDAFLVKLNDAGVRQWATYYGGGSYDVFTDVACDTGSNIYCTGNTSSTSGIATAGAHKTVFSTVSSSVWADAMLVKFNGAGAVQWGTYYGGRYEEEATSVACDLAGNIYIAGATTSDTGIATPGAHMSGTNPLLLLNGYLAKFNASGIRQWGTYYGGSNVDMITDIDCNKNGDILVAGYTLSDTGIATPGAYLTNYQPSFNNHNEDGFVVRFNSSGVRQWGTYYGAGGTTSTEGIDRILSATFDTAGHIYIAGFTTSTSQIGTSGTFLPSYSGFAGFLCQMNASGFPQWGTYYYQALHAVACNPAGDIFVAKAPYFQPGNKISLARFNNTGNRTDSVSLNADNISASLVYCRKNGKLYTAHTVSANTAATAGAHQVIYGGGVSDAFITAWQADSVDTSTSVAVFHYSLQPVLYPNPNKGSFTVEADIPGATPDILLEVVNIMGVVVYRENVATVNGRLDKQLKLDLPNGLYMLRIEDDSGAGSSKFNVVR